MFIVKKCHCSCFTVLLHYYYRCREHNKGLQVGEILQRVFNCFNYYITTDVENITRGYKWGKYYKEHTC
jgi:hypothetical protein